MVYKLLLTSAHSGELILSTEEFQQRDCSVSTAILRVNHLIHDETIEMLYVLNRAIIPFYFKWWSRRRRKPVLIRKDIADGHDLQLRNGSTYHFVGREGCIYGSMLRRLTDIEFISHGWDFGQFSHWDELVVVHLRNLVKVLAEDDTAPQAGETSVKKTLRWAFKPVGRERASPERFYKTMITNLSKRGLFKDLRSLAKVRNVVLEDDVPSEFREEFNRRLFTEEPTGSDLGENMTT